MAWLSGVILLVLLLAFSYSTYSTCLCSQQSVEQNVIQPERTDSRFKTLTETLFTAPVPVATPMPFVVQPTELVVPSVGGIVLQGGTNNYVRVAGTATTDATRNTVGTTNNQIQIYNSGNLTAAFDVDGLYVRALNVTGNSALGGTLGVTGNTTVGGTLGVTGNTTVGGTLGVTGNTTVGANITINNNGALDVYGNTILRSGVVVQSKSGNDVINIQANFNGAATAGNGTYIMPIRNYNGNPSNTTLYGSIYITPSNDVQFRSGSSFYGGGVEGNTLLNDNVFFQTDPPTCFNGDGSKTVYSNSINLRAGNLINNSSVVSYGSSIYIQGGLSVNGAINNSSIVHKSDTHYFNNVIGSVNWAYINSYGIYSYGSVDSANPMTCGNNFSIYNRNGSSSYTILFLGTNGNATGVNMFLNGTTRVDDGGPNVFTIRNDTGGGIRMDSNVTMTKPLTVDKTLTVGYGLNINNSSGYFSNSDFCYVGIGVNGVACSGSSSTTALKVNGVAFSEKGWAWASDRRIKKNITPVVSILPLVRQIEMVSYDKISTREHEVCSVIAQQLQTVFPDAINQLTDFVPNIMSLGNISEGINDTNVIINVPLSVNDDTIQDIKVDSKIKLFIQGKKEDIITTITHLELENGIVVVKKWDNFTINDKVFVYGTEVNNFLSVDKSKLGMLALQGVKELDEKIKKIEELDEKIKKLEALVEKLISEK